MAAPASAEGRFQEGRIRCSARNCIHRSRSTRLSSLIAAGVEIVGDVVVTDGVRVDGQVAGNVLSKKEARGLLVLSEKGRIDGGVKVHDAVINGTISGDVEVEHYLELQADARVTGNIRYRHLQMECGARVDGPLERVAEQHERAAPTQQRRDAADGGGHRYLETARSRRDTCRGSPVALELHRRRELVAARLPLLIETAKRLICSTRGSPALAASTAACSAARNAGWPQLPTQPPGRPRSAAQRDPFRDRAPAAPRCTADDRRRTLRARPAGSTHAACSMLAGDMFLPAELMMISFLRSTIVT